ncbi:MAG: formylglycine-generating enzyme family protein [Leptolyngbyaceae cyanobacterium RM1_406_9]|nr:formylglycine-generating enzyme family protein [Leptolyngbyaceae cyanobacterium RM1_406_9]
MTLPSEPSYPIADLRALLSQRVGLELNPIELAEILWLALQRGEVATEDLQARRSQETSAEKGTQEQKSHSASESSIEKSSSSSAAVVTDSPKRSEASEETTQTEGTALPVNIPEAVALRNRQEIARSLRPLMRKMPSKLRQAIDEEATVIQIAETQTWSPVVKPELERWLELAIVIEVTNLLDVWQDTIAEFQQLMERHGAFRNVRTWQLKSNAAGDPKLFLQTIVGLQGSARSPRELLDASGRRLILLLSDCTSRAWRLGKIYQLLELWSRENPVTIVQLLPEHYWERSALRVGYPVALRSRSPAALSRDWIIDGLSPRRQQRLLAGLKLPVVMMQPESFGQWARAIRAIEEQRTTGIVLNSQAFPTSDWSNQPTAPLTAKQLVQRFRSTASDKAQELADRMAVLPVNWSVIRLIQKNLMPDATEPWQPTDALYLAEIFLSGLLRPVSVVGKSSQNHKTVPQYDFVDGVRDVLLGTIPISEAQAVGEEVAEAVFRQLPIEVQERVQADIEQRYGESLSYFEAFLIPDLPWGEESATEIFQFAQITGRVLRRWGGEYAALAEELERQEEHHLDGKRVYAALEQQLDYFRQEILNTFIQAEHQFEAHFPGLRPKEIAAEPHPEEIILAEGEEISVVILERTITKISEDQASFELKVRIRFAAELSYFDFDAYHAEFNEHPTNEEIVRDQTVDAVAEVTLQFLEDENEVEPELMDLRVEQPILVNPLLTERELPVLTPQLQWFEFEVATIAFEDTSSNNELELFTFEIATIASRQQGQAWQLIEDLGNDIALEIVQIPGGSFVMRAPKSETSSSDSERPKHQVSVPPFFMGKYPVTQAQWKAVAAMPQVNRELDPDPSRFKGSDRPVESISWLDAVEFCDRLSQYTGKHYRLPSEAEWEYACRAGTTTPFHFGETITPNLANYNGDYTYGDGPKGVYRQETTPVGSFGVANAFGLYDMHGNVWEWCQDHWHSDYEGAPTDGSAWLSKDKNAGHILRGGSWSSNPRNCRSAARDYSSPDSHYSKLGFRVVCSAPRTL